MPDAGSSPELYDFSIPCTKTQVEDTGRWRRSSRTHLGRFYGRRRPEGRRLRAAAVVFSGEIQISRRLRLGLRKSARLRKRDRGASLGLYRGAQSTKSRKKRGCCLLRREKPPSPARPRRAEKKEARWGELTRGPELSVGEEGGTQLSAGEGGQGSAAGLATALSALGRERKELGFGAARPQKVSWAARRGKRKGRGFGPAGVFSFVFLFLFFFSVF